MKNFVLIGAAGYIAPRHMRAIKNSGNNLIAALDVNDSVGIIDSYFPHAHFFTEFERLDRHLCKLIRQNVKIDYVSICSPNYLHDAHIRYALRIGANVICEKPLVLNPWNLNSLIELQKETGLKVNSILQLRLHPTIKKLKQDCQNSNHIHDVNIHYITSRGNWYHNSWKGDENKSGGIATNIGIHFFDMVQWIFGDVLQNKIYSYHKDKAEGFLLLEKARVNWFLSIDENNIPDDIRSDGKRTFRSITIDGIELEFSEGFESLHDKSYKKILKGKGFSIADASAAISIVSNIRKAYQSSRMEIINQTPAIAISSTNGL